MEGYPNRFGPIYIWVHAIIDTSLHAIAVTIDRISDQKLVFTVIVLRMSCRYIKKKDNGY